MKRKDRVSHGIESTNTGLRLNENTPLSDNLNNSRENVFSSRNSQENSEIIESQNYY